MLVLLSSYAVSDNSYFIQGSWTPATELTEILSDRFLTQHDTDSIGRGRNYLKCTEENGVFYYQFSTAIETGFIITPEQLNIHNNCVNSADAEITNQLKLIENKLKTLGLPNKSSINLKYESLVTKMECDNSYYFYENTSIYFTPNNKIKSIFYSLSSEHHSTCKQ